MTEAADFAMLSHPGCRSTLTAHSLIIGEQNANKRYKETLGRGISMNTARVELRSTRGLGRTMLRYIPRLMGGSSAYIDAGVFGDGLRVVNAGRSEDTERMDGRSDLISGCADLLDSPTDGQNENDREEFRNKVH